MSKARPVYPGAVLFCTRRVHKRQLLLRPDRHLNRAIEYIVAVLVKRHNILLHALCVMSNHIHYVATDPLGRIVEFQRECHELITRVVNSMHGDFESMWALEQGSRIDCADPTAVVDKIAYTMANPVAAGLVTSGHCWPGVRCAWPMKPRIASRPRFFRTEAMGGSWPGEATLEFHRPPGYDDLSDAELAEVLYRAIDEREHKARAAAKASSKAFLGRARVLRQSRYAYPTSWEKRFAMRPTVAGRSKWARIERLQRNRDWLKRYEDAARRLRAGQRNVCFPFGTYKMCVFYRVACDPRPPPDVRPTAIASSFSAVS